MDANGLFIVLVLAYFVLAPLFAFWRWQDIRAERQLYPSRPREKYFTSKVLAIATVWLTGAVAIFLAINANLKVSAALLLLFISIGASSLIARMVRTKGTKHYLGSAVLRYWIAASSFWLLLLLSWQVTFGFSPKLSHQKLILLAALPPILILVGYRLFKWAKGSRGEA